MRRCCDSAACCCSKTNKQNPRKNKQTNGVFKHHPIHLVRPCSALSLSFPLAHARSLAAQLLLPRPPLSSPLLAPVATAAPPSLLIPSPARAAGRRRHCAVRSICHRREEWGSESGVCRFEFDDPVKHETSRCCCHRTLCSSPPLALPLPAHSHPPARACAPRGQAAHREGGKRVKGAKTRERERGEREPDRTRPRVGWCFKTPFCFFGCFFSGRSLFVLEDAGAER